MLDVSIISFDCYGTLIDWETGIRRALASTQSLRDVAEFKGPFDLEEMVHKWEAFQFSMLQGKYRPYREILKKSFLKTLELVGVPATSQEAESFVASLPDWPPFPEVRETLQLLQRQHKLAIISNIDRDLIQPSLKALDVPFSWVVTAEDARAYKPGKEIFSYALQQFRTEPAKVLHVAFGDRYDLIPARALGFQTVWVNRKGKPSEEIAGAQKTPGVAMYQVQDLRGILPLLGLARV